MDPYVVKVTENESRPYIEYIFHYAPQSLIIAIMEYCGLKSDFITTEGYSLLHYAVFFNCFEVVCFLLQECSDIDINVTNNFMYTPLHLAYLCRHTQIVQYLIQHGADICATDSDGFIPCDYIDGNPNWIEELEYLQIKRKIHHIPYSIEHCYFMRLVSIENDEEEAVALTMEQFPSLKENRTT